MKRTIKILVLTILIFSLTGCTKQLTDNNDKPVKNNGKTLTLNILCKPTDESVIKLYEENKVNISKLPACEDFKITSGEYEGIWTSFFIKPLAFLLLKLTYLVNSVGLAIIIFSFSIRMLIYPITQKTAKQSQNMKKAQPELDKLEKKYKGQTDSNSMMQKSQEMMQIYKKYDISPMSGCLFAFIQFPIFIGFLEAINRIPTIFEGKFLSLDLGTTTLSGIMAGNLTYIILILLIMGTTYYTFSNMSTTGTSEQQKQMQMMSKIMMIVISVTSLFLATAIAIYWITSSIITIIQNKIVKRSNEDASV